MKYITPIQPINEDDLLSKTYAQIQQEALPIPILVMHSVSPKLFASNWSLFRETFLVNHQVNRDVKEAINLAVSKLNTCPYCIEAHTIMLSGLQQQKVADAIVNHDLNAITNLQLKSIVEWALASNQPNHPRLQNPPFNLVEAPEIIGAALNFHYTNRLVNIFIEPELIPLTFGEAMNRWLICDRMIKTGLIGTSRNPGVSLALLPPTTVSDHFPWATPNPFISQALARHAFAIKEIIDQFVSQDIQDFVEQTISQWDGQDKGISRQWVEILTQRFDLAGKALTKLALLTAFSSFQVDETIINEFKCHFPQDEQLLAVIAWASFHTAKIIASWTILPPKVLST